MSRNFCLTVLAAALWLCGWTAAAAATTPRFILDFDLNGDNLVTIDEFIGPEEHFAELDRNHNGYIEAEETPQGPPPGLDPARLLGACDQDGDELLTAAEFTGPAEVFVGLDQDEDGFLNLAELAAAPSCGPPRGNFAADDCNQDGLVSAAEFSGPSAHFEELDRDGDGYLSREEAQAAGHRPPPPPNDPS